jgi:hypothetical protein
MVMVSGGKSRIDRDGNRDNRHSDWVAGFSPAEPYTNSAEGQQAGRRAQADETNLLHEETAAVKGAEAKRKNSSNR